MSQIAAPQDHIAVTGKTKGLERLRDWPSLDIVWAVDVNQKQFEHLLANINPKALSVYCMRVPELGPIAGLKRLTDLSLTWNTKARSLEVMPSVDGLRVLQVEDFTKVSTIEPLSRCQDLEIVDLSGGIWKVFRVDSLAPLRMLERLRFLRLMNIRVADGSLEPLSGLTRLARLELSNQFPTAEYAKLSVHLPKTECDCFRPFKEVALPIGDKDIMVVGKGKPFLNSRKDRKRLEKYEAQFRRTQDEERARQAH